MLAKHLGQHKRAVFSGWRDYTRSRVRARKVRLRAEHPEWFEKEAKAERMQALAAGHGQFPISRRSTELQVVLAHVSEH